MTLAEYLSVLRRQWWVPLTLTALSLGLACAYTFTATPVYTARATLFVSVTTGGASAADLSSGSAFVQQRVKSYAEIMTSDEVLDGVITSLRLQTTRDELAQRITVESPLDTVLLQLSVTDTDAERAAAIANGVARVFPGYVDQLERVSDSQVSPVRVMKIRPASAPQAPSSPRVPLNLALGLLVGLGLGAGVAVLRQQTSTAVTGPEDVKRVTGAAPLAAVPHDKAAARQPLIDVRDREGRAEALRILRTNLQFANVDDPPRVIVVTSALPGEGKSTTACNLALTLAFAGADVALVEGDLRKPSVSQYLGLSNQVGLTNVLAGQRKLGDVLVPYEAGRLVVLPSGPTPPNPAEMLGSDQLSRVIATLRNHVDCVIVDAAPLLPVTDAAVLAAQADGVLLVARHRSSRREHLKQALQTLSAVNATLLGTVLNDVPRRRGHKGVNDYGYGYSSPVTEMPTPLALANKLPTPAVDLTRIQPEEPAGTVSAPGGPR